MPAALVLPAASVAVTDSVYVPSRPAPLRSTVVVGPQVIAVLGTGVAAGDRAGDTSRRAPRPTPRTAAPSRCPARTPARTAHRRHGRWSRVEQISRGAGRGRDVAGRVSRGDGQHVRAVAESGEIERSVRRAQVREDGGGAGAGQHTVKEASDSLSSIVNVGVRSFDGDGGADTVGSVVGWCRGCSSRSGRAGVAGRIGRGDRQRVVAVAADPAQVNRRECAAGDRRRRHRRHTGDRTVVGDARLGVRDGELRRVTLPSDSSGADNVTTAPVAAWCPGRRTPSRGALVLPAGSVAVTDSEYVPSPKPLRSNIPSTGH